jgi:hypothetical protein
MLRRENFTTCRRQGRPALVCATTEMVDALNRSRHDDAVDAEARSP